MFRFSFLNIFQLFIIYPCWWSFTFAAHVHIYTYNTTVAVSDKVNVLNWGAKGDGITDDQKAIQKAIQYCVQNKKVCYIPRTKHFYLVKSTIRVPLAGGESIYILSNNALIKPAFPFTNHSLAGLTAFQEKTVLSIGPENLGKKAPSVSNIFDNNLGITVRISGLRIDGSSIPYMSIPQGFHTPICIGMAISAERIIVSRCYFQNIFGDGIMAMGPGYFSCIGNTFTHVGGRGKTPYAFKIDNDQFGDAINISAVRKNGNIIIDSCHLLGYMGNGRRSRCGITFNFSKYNYNVYIKSCVVIDYAKCIHIEEKTASKFDITACVLKNFDYAIANVTDIGTVCKFSNCKIEVSQNDGQDAAGAALLGLNYESNANLYFYNSVIEFKNAGQYQSVAPVKLFDHCTFNVNHLNIFFADADTLMFNQCTFNEFGGVDKSFYKCCGGKMNVTIKDCYFKNSGPIKANKNNINLKVIGTPTFEQ